ncbi:MAG: 4'-phosphopantetheinyl transferase family protein [Beijerinckiaceae bacterium]
MDNPSSAPFLPLLTIGTAAAFLVDGIADQRGARDAAATDIVSRYAGSPVIVQRRPSGRPCLLPPWPALSISLSHRDGFLLTGFSPSQAVGVDIEGDDPALHVRQLAADHFSCDEAAAFHALSDNDARALFLRLWTAKEAVLKATGRGIADGLMRPDFGRCLTTLCHDGGIVRVMADDSDAQAQVSTQLIITSEGQRLCTALAVLTD